MTMRDELERREVVHRLARMREELENARREMELGLARMESIDQRMGELVQRLSDTAEIELRLVRQARDAERAHEA